MILAVTTFYDLSNRMNVDFRFDCVQALTNFYDLSNRLIVDFRFECVQALTSIFISFFNSSYLDDES